MGFFDSISSWFRREASDVKVAVDQAHDRLDADLSRKERELEASPEQRMEMIQEEIDATGDPFDDVRARIDGQAARAEATEELAAEQTVDDSADEPPIGH